MALVRRASYNGEGVCEVWKRVRRAKRKLHCNAGVGGCGMAHRRQCCKSGQAGIVMLMCMMCVVVAQVQGSVGVGVAQLTCSLQHSSQLARSASFPLISRAVVAACCLLLMEQHKTCE